MIKQTEAEDTNSSVDIAVSDKGEWIPAACWFNCGSQCANYALVVDGEVVRQKTDDTHEDSPDYPQQRGCIRGRSQRKNVFGADRLKYPMKRKHWEPGGGDKSLRGRDEWVRISWDEAFDILSSEIKRVVEKYGNRSILSFGGPCNAINSYGGAVSHYGSTSYGSWQVTPFLMGYMPYSYPVFDRPGYIQWAASYTSRDTINDRLDLRNCETIIMISLNTAWNSAGTNNYHWAQAKKTGAKFIAVDPYYNDLAQAMDADWLPVRPGTDMALLLGVAYTLITEDDPENNPLIDWDFLDRCTLGFDADHMPEGVNPEENFKDYVLGTYDGIPKTPEWASEICGLEPERIRYLAQEMRVDKKVAIVCGWASARTQNSDNLPQMIATIGAMTGHMGKSGHMTGPSHSYFTANGGLSLVNPGSAGLPTISNPVDDAIHLGEVWNAILTHKYNFCGKGLYLPREERDIDIEMIYFYKYMNKLQTAEDMNSGIEAVRQVEFVVTQDYTLSTSAMFSDLVLPTTTEWETIGGFPRNSFPNREVVIAYRNVVPPLFEAKTDQEIDIELCKRLGVDVDSVYPFGPKQQFFNELKSCTVIQDNGVDYGPLITITEEDIESWGVEGTPQEGKISLEEFLKTGYYQVKRSPGDNYGYIAFEAFRNDPEAHPLPSSASGKIEIYSTGLAERINAAGWSEIKPLPTYVPPKNGYECTFENWETKEKGAYPYQIINPHYLRRAHSGFDNVLQLREAFPNPVYLNASDAREKGIEDGDTVLIENMNGKTLRRAVVTERLMPGIVSLPHGSWVDPDPETGIDRGGADNILTSALLQGQGVEAFNSNIVTFEKYAGEPLLPDVERPQRIAVVEGDDE